MRKVKKQRITPVGKCAVCGSETKVGEITHYAMRNNEVCVIKNVPAYICSSDWCGNEWIEQVTLKAIDHLILGESLYETRAKIYDYHTMSGMVASPWSLGGEEHEQDSRTARRLRKKSKR